MCNLLMWLIYGSVGRFCGWPGRFYAKYVCVFLSYIKEKPLVKKMVFGPYSCMPEQNIPPTKTKHQIVSELETNYKSTCTLLILGSHFA